MQRRRFVISASGAVITAIAPECRVNLLGFIGVATAHAQGRGGVPAIGYLSRGFPGGRGHDAFRQGLREIGYDENGKTLVVHHRFAEGNDERLADLAAELVRLNVDIIVASLRAPERLTK